MTDDDVVKARLRKISEKLPDVRLMKMNGQVFTPDDVVQEVEEDTPMGRVFKKAEEKMLERVKEKEKKAQRG